MKSAKSSSKFQEDQWIATQCGRCYGLCGVRVRRINSVAVKIEGQPDSTHGPRGVIMV